MPAQGEEVVVPSYALALQQGFPDGSEGLFQFALRGFVAVALQGLTVRGRQGFAVEFAVGCQREGVEHDPGLRQHVVGQFLRQGAAHCGGVDAVAVSRDQVGHQLGIAVLRTARCAAVWCAAVWCAICHDDGFADAFLRDQFRFDFSQFDAESSYLDLVVVAAQVFDVAVCQVAGQVACLVHARARLAGFAGIGVVHEAFSSQFGAVEVAACHAGAADVYFSGNSQRNRLPLPIEQVDAGVGDGPADVQDGVAGGECAGGGDNGGLGRAVVVDEGVTGPGVWTTAQTVAADQQVLQVPVGRLACHGGFGQGGDEEAGVEGFLFPPGQQLLRIVGAGTRGQYQAGAAA